MNDKEVKQFYNSKAWKQKRVDILKRDRFECQDCIRRLQDAKESGELLTGYESKIHSAKEVHHIKELRERPDLRLDEDNLVGLCTRCHNERHGRRPQYFNKPKERLTEEKW